MCPTRCLCVICGDLNSRASANIAPVHYVLRPCLTVMLHGWSDIGPICVLQVASDEEMYLRGAGSDESSAWSVTRK